MTSTVTSPRLPAPSAASGGWAYLAANVASARAEVVHSVFVSAGDLIGGSPLVSALFHNEPTIEAMNLMGLDINAVGNHEFDEGPKGLAPDATGRDTSDRW